MHAASVFAKDWFGHECGIITMLPGDFLDHDAIGHGFVRHAERIVKPQVDLMLARSHLMMAVFHLYAQVLQSKNRFPS